jgi:putative ABC transport system permease protein
MLPEQINGIWLRIKALFRRRRLERDLEDELEFHLAMRRQKLVEQGMPPEEARFAARRAFGNPTHARESNRELWTFPFLETLAQDLRYGLRQLRRNPGFTEVAVLTLALGIGANTTIFSVVSAVLLRPFPFEMPSHLVVLWQKVPHFGTNIFTTPDFLAWRSQSFMPISGISTKEFNVGTGDRADHVSGGPVSANFFSMLGVKPILGRAFLPKEDQPDGERVVILSYGLWQRDFAGDRSVIGKAADLNGQPFTVVGVMPKGFKNPVVTDQQLWVPLESDPLFSSFRQSEGVHWLFVLGRLKAEVDPGRAAAAMKAIGVNLGKEYPRTEARLGVSITPLDDFVVGDIRPALLIMLAAVGFVLLIACANVVNLFLARGMTRANEIAVRRALGAGRTRVFRQLLTESVLISFLGGAVGVILSFWGLRLLQTLNPGTIPRAGGLTLDAQVLLFTLGVSLLAGIIFGTVPALRVSKSDINETLKEGGRSVRADLSARRLHGLVMVSEIGLAVVLLVGAGLMVRSFRDLMRARLGFDPRHILTMQMTFNQQAASPQETPLFYEHVLERVRALPGVESAALARDLPLVGANPSIPFRIAGRTLPASGRKPIARYRAISSGYFSTMRIPLFEGRDFTGQDARGASCVAIINQAMARRYWPYRNPMGAEIKPDRGAPEWCTIIGVAGNVRKGGPGFPVQSTMYFSYLQVPDADIPVVEGSMRLVVRSASPLSLVGGIRKQVTAINGGVPVYDVRTMSEIVSGSLARPRFDMALLAIFAIVALVMAAAGIYGVLSYSVAQRTHEVGIRMALGAEKREILRMVVGQGLKLALIGVAIGTAGALALTRFLSSLLYGVKPTDPLTFIAVSLILIAVSLLACYIPARRASKVDPMDALRYE